MRGFKKVLGEDFRSTGVQAIVVILPSLNCRHLILQKLSSVASGGFFSDFGRIYGIN